MRDSDGEALQERADQLRAWITRRERGVRSRGWDLHRRGRVLSCGSIRANQIVGTVSGSAMYSVLLSHDGRAWSSRCSCPYKFDCKHAVALAEKWIETFVDDSAPPTPARPPAGSIPKPPKRRNDADALLDTWRARIEAGLGRPLEPADEKTVRDFAELFDAYRSDAQCLHNQDLNRCGFGEAVPSGASYLEPLFFEQMEECRPENALELLPFVAAGYRLNGAELPAALQPLTDAAKVESLLATWLEEQQLAAWNRAANQDASQPTQSFIARPLPKLHGFRARLTSAGSAVLERRTGPEAIWKVETQDSVVQLTLATPADLPELPTADLALAMTVAAFVRQGPAYYSRSAGMAPALLEKLLTSPLTRGACVLPDGSPVGWEPAKLVLEAGFTDGSAQRLALRLTTEDRRDAAAAQRLATVSDLYLFEGRIRPGPPPPPADLLPVRALEQRNVRRLLRRLEVRLPPSLVLAVPVVPLRLAIRLLPEPGWYESGQAELLVQGSDPAHEHRWDNGRWQRVRRAKDAASNKNEVDLAFPDPSAAMSALSSAPFHRGYGGRWYYQLPKGTPESLLEWYAALPADIVVLAPPELASLFKPPSRATLDWSAVPDAAAQDWFDLSIQLKVDDTELNPDEVALLLKARGKWIRLPRKGWRRLEVTAEGLDAVTATLDQLGLGAEQVLATQGMAKHRLHTLQLAGAAAELDARNEEAARHLRRRLDAISQRPPAELPTDLTATLRPYQKDGFQFLAHLSALGFGGLLADDMGLGKTVQALAWLLHLRQERKGKAPFRTLVVCPKSVVHGWGAEAARFAPGLRCAVFAPGTEEEAGKAELVVANYAQVRLRETWFTGQRWNAAILDEAQFIKNPGSQIARSVAALPAPHRLLLTGTPVENRVTDIWSLFAFAQPGLLGSLASFRRDYDPKVAGSTERLHRRIRHFLLRRTKGEVATDLPARTEDELVVEMEGAQRKLYEAELKRARQQLLGLATARDLDRARFNVLASLLRLRQICCHPALLDPAYAELPSAKLAALMERLDELRDEGHQVLVFSQFVEMLQLIRAGLVERNIGHLMLTGATEDRGALVEEFQRDRSKTVFLLSLKAAGFGLNLTAASYAILYDPWWNPAVEAQAIDRTHRIGQTKPVIAYRLIAADSIEQKIRSLQRDKAALAATIVREESLQSVMNLDSLREILR